MISRMIHIGLAAAAGLALTAWQPAQAQCNTTAWTATSGAPVAGGPGAGVPIYQGACSLRPVTGATPSFVEESTRHAAEGGGGAPYIARFFYYAGITGANPVVFRAFDADSGGNQVIQVQHDATNQRVSFTVNGTTQNTPNNSAFNGKWVEVAFTYNASGQFTARTRSLTAANFIGDVISNITPINTGAATVERIQLGNVANGGGTGILSVDEYEASRQIGGTPATALSVKCRGDVDNNQDIGAGDRSAVTAAIRGTLPAERRPDCNEDGDIGSADRSCVTALIRDLTRTCP